MPGRSDEFRPTVSAAQVERIRQRHERAYADLRQRETVEITYLGLQLAVPSEVFVPTATSDLLGRLKGRIQLDVKICQPTGM